jgi:hypothetical protein
LAQLEGLAAEPVLMFDWNDPTSRELLDLIVDRLPTLAVLLIRPKLAPPWVGPPQMTLLSLSPGTAAARRDDQARDRRERLICRAL